MFHFVENFTFFSVELYEIKGERGVEGPREEEGDPRETKVVVVEGKGVGLLAEKVVRMRKNEIVFLICFCLTILRRQ